MVRAGESHGSRARRTCGSPGPRGRGAIHRPIAAVRRPDLLRAAPRLAARSTIHVTSRAHIVLASILQMTLSSMVRIWNWQPLIRLEARRRQERAQLARTLHRVGLLSVAPSRHFRRADKRRSFFQIPPPVSIRRRLSRRRPDNRPQYRVSLIS